MSLTGAIQIARSALTTSQLGLQLASQNLANLANPAYTRQMSLLESIRGQASDKFQPGRGVQIRAIQRQIDNALQARLRNGISDEQAATQKLQVASELESVLNELTGYDLSSELNEFFSSWSEAANLVNSDSVVVEQGDRLASFMRELRADLTTLRDRIESDIDAAVQGADAKLDEIAQLNGAIAVAGPGNASANALRDRRDELVNELSAMMDVSVVEDPQGNYDVFVGSVPVVLGGLSRGLEIERVPDGDHLSVRVRVSEDQSPIEISSGSIGGLLDSRNGVVDDTIDRLDTLAGQLVFEVNKRHSVGTNSNGLRSVRAGTQVAAEDLTRAFNSGENTTFSDLPYAAENGGFFVEVTNTVTGATTRVRIEVDLDGLTDAGVPGTEDDTTPQQIAEALNAVSGLTARFNSDGKLQVSAASGLRFRFAEDSSGVLAVLGVNSYFTGTDASSIAISDQLLEDPTRLMLGTIEGDQYVENAIALSMVDLQDVALTALGGLSVQGHWSSAVQHVGVESSSARTLSEAASVVRESLEAQRASVSGVSADEESINLLNHQQQYQGAARVIALADEMLQTLLSIV
ncbi:MAG: flagellar hook-associated protein FlgK [Leptolyngbya sp. PLA3]|nr:MAG: flagellar hook-associated protein FlgK [Cyanobacteria bacterium CYA]MCE7968064.1 flagellar hook-associated protein FlgK [Leptolyngbya sp. PL-A3]